MSVKNRNDPIGNRTRDLTACSEVCQPTASPVGTVTERICVLSVSVSIQRFQLNVSEDGVVNTFRPVIMKFSNACTVYGIRHFFNTTSTHNICFIRTCDAYLLRVSVHVNFHQGEELCQFREKPTAILTLLSVDSVL